MKQIIISEVDDDITLKADKGVKWSTFITGIEMLIECIKENSEVPIDIENILADIKRIYERDNQK